MLTAESPKAVQGPYRTKIFFGDLPSGMRQGSYRTYRTIESAGLPNAHTLRKLPRGADGYSFLFRNNRDSAFGDTVSIDLRNPTLEFFEGAI